MQAGIIARQCDGMHTAATSSFYGEVSDAEYWESSHIIQLLRKYQTLDEMRANQGGHLEDYTYSSGNPIARCAPLSNMKWPILYSDSEMRTT